ncbi:lipopolysaccharide transport periplasmic protein LptA [Marinobacter koreensis]|uniref:Lipopolysaccharide export system protein LptA n=1 Tax=Marinobacter koreensis TaxID=335974 RepID=A0ABW0RIK7_9GAMM|nr:lipopolysaccharide transport periplasmic protein LptA [Marinobacter koreensis]MCK7546937.1 lipopolysaccharide transport periplasmic protein LptA [Marinobacter koreensis]
MKLLDKPISLLAIAMLSSLVALPAWAFDLDSDIPIKVNADHARLDDNQGIATYTGDVILTQGETRLDADRVVLFRNAEGLNRIEATGNPAHYRQPTRDGNGETDARATNITWSAQDKQLTFEKDAVIKQNGNVFRGDLIHYDTVQRVVTAQGSPDNGSGSGRVEMVIQPRSTKKGSDGSSQSQ